jgi:hypothetical protein
MTLLSQHVDTFKEALYFNGDLTKYNDFVSLLISLKEDAQLIKDINNDNRFVVFNMDGIKWHIMAVSIKGYSVVLKSNDVSIAFRKKGDLKSDRNPQVKIEYRAQFLVNYGFIEAYKIINDFIKKNIHFDYISKVQEIHLACDVQGHNFNLFDIYRMKTRARKSRIMDGDDNEIGRTFVFSSRKLETLYFGTGSNMLRIYNKTNEIAHHAESGQIKRLWSLNSLYDENKDVWRIEFQIRREKLKSLFNPNSEPFEYTKVLLDSVPSLWDYFINYFSYRDISQDMAIDLIKGYHTLKNGKEKLFTKEAEKNIYRRSEIHPLWEKIKLFNQIEPKYHFRFIEAKQTEPIYAMNSVCSLVSTTLKHYGTLSPETINAVINDANERSLKNYDQTIYERAEKKQLDYFSKVEKQNNLGLTYIAIRDKNGKIQDFEELSPEDNMNDNFGYFLNDSLSPIHDAYEASKLF